MKKLEEGKFYSIKLNIEGRDLVYRGKVLSLKEKEFRIKTENNALDFQLKDLISAKEIEGWKHFDENKVFVIKKKGPLKEGHKPKGL